MRKLWTLAVVLALCTPVVAQQYVTPEGIANRDYPGHVRAVDDDPDGNACTLNDPPSVLVYHSGSTYTTYTCQSSLWTAVAAGSGDMLQSAYDKNADSVVDKVDSGALGSIPGAPEAGDIYIGNDSLAGADCSTAGGSVLVMCRYNGASWGVVTSSAAGGTPAGSTTEMQFNTSGAFAADSDLTYTTGTDTLGVTNIVTKGTPVYTVQAYGAVCDGAGLTDDYAAIQAAIDAAEAAGGGVVYLGASSGQCNFGTTLTITDNVTIMGMGRAASSLRYTGSGTAITSATPTVRTYKNSIRHLSISNTGSGSVGLDLACMSDSYFEDVWVTGFTTGIHINCAGTPGGAVYNSFVEVTTVNGATGLFIDEDQSNENIFTNFRANNASTYGIRILNGNHNVFFGATIESSTGTGIYIAAGAQRTHGNTFYSPRLEGAQVPLNIQASVDHTSVIAPFESGGTGAIDANDAGTGTMIWGGIEGDSDDFQQIHGNPKFADDVEVVGTLAAGDTTITGFISATDIVQTAQGVKANRYIGGQINNTNDSGTSSSDVRLVVGDTGGAPVGDFHLSATGANAFNIYDAKNAANRLTIDNAGAVSFGGSLTVTGDIDGPLAADIVDGIGEIDAALLSGADTTLITGTEGTSGNCAEWNADGDLVDSGGVCGGGGAEVNNLETTYPPNVLDDEVYIGTGSATGAWTAMQNCDAGTEKLNWNGTAFTCETDATGGSPGADTIGTSELDDGADTPLSGEYIRVDTVDQAGVEYRTTAEVLSDIGAAPSAQGVTGGDSHDHEGGDGAQIDHVDLANKGSNAHSVIDTHLGAANPHSGSAASGANSDITSLASLSTPLTVAQGGVGVGTLANNSLLLGNDASAVSALGVATNGQIPIGSTGADPVLAAIAAEGGGEVTVTNAAGSITLDVGANTLDQSELAATITFANADLVDFGTNVDSATEGLMIPAHATDCTTATAEGQICWEEGDQDLFVGNGAAAVQMNGVGDCAAGPCLDGTSDGGSTITFYDVGGNIALDWDGSTLDFGGPIAASSFQADDPGDNLRGITLEDNTTTCADPSSTFTNICTIGGVPYYRDTTETAKPLGITGADTSVVVMTATDTPGVDAGITYDDATDVLMVAGSFSAGTNPATAGKLRIPNNTGLYARNVGNDGNILLAYATPADAVGIGIGAATAIVLDTDGTGDTEVVLPNDSIGPDEVLAAGQTDGDFLLYETTGDTWAWLTANAGTDITADLEEETHVTEHAENGADELLGESMGTACTENQILKANATGGLDCAADDAGGGSYTFDVTDTDATPILTVDTTEQVQFIGTAPITTTAAADASNHDLTIACSDATTSTKGCASFAAADFDVTSGAVSIDGTTWASDAELAAQDTCAELSGCVVSAITASGVTYENLDSAGDVGTSAGQVAIGNHNHDATYGTIAGETWTGVHDFSAADLEIPNGTATVGTDCDAAGEAGRLFVETDLTSGQQLYVCEGASGWKLVGDTVYAPLASPALTGDPTGVTAGANDNDTSLASTAFVQQEINGAGGTNLSCSSGQCNVDDAFLLLAGDTTTGSYDFSGGHIEVPNSTATTAGDCDAAGEAGRIYVDTDATSGQQLYVCEGTSGWKLSGDGGGSITGTDTHVMFFDGANNPAGDAGMTYVKGTDTLTVAGGIDVGASALPGMDLTDSDTTDEDVSATFEANAIATGTGVEDIDVTISHQVAGAMTDAIKAIADTTGSAGPAAVATPHLLQLGSMTTASATCIDVDTDRPYADKDCDSTKDGGEEYLDQASASAPTHNECFTLYDTGGIGAADDIPSIWKAPAAVTITEFWCEGDEATGTVMNLQRDDGTPANVLSSNKTCTTTAGTGTLDGAEDNFADGDRLDLVIVSVAGTPANRLNFCIEYTYD